MRSLTRAAIRPAAHLGYVMYGSGVSPIDETESRGLGSIPGRRMIATPHTAQSWSTPAADERSVSASCKFDYNNSNRETDIVCCATEGQADRCSDPCAMRCRFDVRPG